MVRTILNLLAFTKGKAPRADLELVRWAQTEYGSEWKWAYEQMLSKPGVTPKFLKGVTL
tara:strand:- start:2397 stop:2573 length:177 start_codon:yes stop_codon:yes gene_type:complete